MSHKSRRRPVAWGTRLAVALCVGALAAGAHAAGPPTLRCEADGADVPFEVSPGAAAVRVWARAAGNGGPAGDWAVVATVPPAAGGVRFVPGRPGVYDLCVRALDADGLAVPPGPLTAGLRVRCDPAAVPAALQVPAGPAAGGGFPPPPGYDEGFGTGFERSPGSPPDALPAPLPSSLPVPGDATGGAGADGFGAFPPVGSPPRSAASGTALSGGPYQPGGPYQNVNSRDPFRPVPGRGDVVDREDFAGVPPLAAPAPLPVATGTSADAFDPPAGYDPAPSAGAAVPDADRRPGEVDPVRARVLLGAARNAVARGALDEAAARFGEYLAERPGDVAVRAELAGVFIQAGRTAEAAAAFELLLAANPRDPVALLGYADLLIGLGQFATAREQLLVALAVTARPDRVRPRDEDPAVAARRWDAAVKLVRTYLLEGRPADAAGAAAAHLAAGPPADPGARLKYARLLMELGRPADARPLLAALARELPADPRPVADLLLANVRLLDGPAASEAAAALAARPVSDPGLWLGLGEALYRDDALREARRVLGQLIAAVPENDPAAVLLARTQSRLLELAPARQALEHLEPRLGGETRFEAAFTEHLIIAGEWSAAAARAKTRLRDRPADAAALRDLGDALHASGQYLRAEGQYAKVCSLLPEEAEPVFLRAKNLAFRRDFDPALTYLETLRARRPGDVRVPLRIADVLTKRGGPADLARAQAELTRPPAAPRTPRQEAAYHIKLAEVLIDRRRPSEALRELDRLPAMAAGEPTAVYFRSRALAALGRFDAATAVLGGSGSPLSPMAGDAYTLLSVAGFAVGDCECCLAQDLAARVLSFAPEHPLAGNLRAEAMLLCRPTGGLIPNCGTGNCCGGGCGGDCGDGGIFCALFDALEPATSEGCGEPLCRFGKCGNCPPPPRPAGPCEDCVAGLGGCTKVGGCGAGCGGGAPETRGAAGVFGFVLSAHPDNSRAQLGYARSLGAMLKYWDANVAYQRYLAGLPADVNVTRERGRLVDAWKGYAAADHIYAAATAAVDPDAAVAASLAAPGDLFGGPGTPAFPGIEPFGGEALDPGVGGPGGFGGGGSPVPGGSVVPALDEEYQALSTLREIASTEQLAKKLRTHRPRRAGPLYRGLIELEPANQDARFDLAQALGARGYTRAAERVYRELLDVNPCHSQARVALERHRLWRRPAAFGEFDLREISGRDGLADLERTVFSVGGRLVTGDAADAITAIYSHVILEPSRAAGRPDRFHGEVGTLRFARRLRGELSGWAQVNVEEYDDGAFSTRPTFDAGLAWVNGAEATVRAFAFLENVALNRESLAQDIHRVGLQTDAYWLATRRWQLDAFYRASDYSDDNFAHEAGLHSGLILRPGRRQVRLRTDVDFSAFREFTVRDPLTGLRDATHPYFSPDAFAFGTLGLEWKHWLSCDTFLGANALWYELYAAARFDSDSESYGLFTAALNWDLTNQCTFTADAGFIRGEIYDETRARAYLEWRFR